MSSIDSSPTSVESPPAPTPRHLELARLGLRRLGAAVALLLGVTVVTFALVQVVPGNAATANLGQQGVLDPNVVKAFESKYGLDQPLPVQYWRYLKRLAHGDLGVSTQNDVPVARNLTHYIPATLEIAIPAAVLSFLVSIALGTVAALRRGRAVDQGVRIISLFGVSMPPFWLALTSVYLFFFHFRLLPSGGRLSPQYDSPPHVTGLLTVDSILSGQWSKLSDAATHLVLPVFVLVVFTVGQLTRFIRSAVLEVINRDYVRTAWSKGLPTRIVLLRHILRPALVQIITVFGIAFSALMAGSVLVEYVFSWPGLGQYAYRSTTGLDLPSITGITLFIAAVYVAINFVVDVLYGVIDPRIRLR